MCHAQVDAWPIVLYPFVYVLPHTGSVAMFAGTTVSRVRLLTLLWHCSGTADTALALIILESMSNRTNSPGCKGICAPTARPAA